MRLGDSTGALEFARKERDVEVYCQGQETSHMLNDENYAFTWLEARERDERNTIERTQRANEQKVKRALRTWESLPSDVEKCSTGAENKGVKHIQPFPHGDEALMQHGRPQEEVGGEAAKRKNDSAKKKDKERQRKRRGCIRHAGTVCGFPTEDIDAIINNLSHDQQAVLATRLTKIGQQHWTHVFEEERKELVKDAAPT